MAYKIASTERMPVVQARVRRMDRLDKALRAKRAALLAKTRLTGRDASRYVTLSQALARLDCLHPFHRVRYLPG